MDGGLWATPAYGGGDFDGGRGVDWTGKHLDARDVLFFLNAECAGIRVRRAAAKPGAIVALVRTVSRESDGTRVPGNRVGRCGGAVDFAHSGAALWLASGASKARTFDSGNCFSRSFARERTAAREKDRRAGWIRGGPWHVHHNPFFSADTRQHVFYCRGEWRTAKTKTFFESRSSFCAEPGRAGFVS